MLQQETEKTIKNTFPYHMNSLGVNDREKA